MQFLAVAANNVNIPIPGGFSWTTLLAGIVIGMAIVLKIKK